MNTPLTHFWVPAQSHTERVPASIEARLLADGTFSPLPAVARFSLSLSPLDPLKVFHLTVVFLLLSVKEYFDN